MHYVIGEYELDTTRFELSRAGAAISTEPQVLELLIFLVDHRNRVVSRDELFETIWKGRIVSETTLSSRIKTARQCIGDDGKQQRFIKTIHGRGFRFVGSVEQRELASTLQPAADTIAPTDERPRTRYARSGDIYIAYQTFGDGPVNLILTPGFVSHIDNYWDDPLVAAWLSTLGCIARVAMFDKRGTGLSDRVTALPSLDERMDDVRAVMDAAEFESAFIMGISEGGSLAAMFAGHHPKRCDGLLLYGAFARFEHWYSDEASLQALFDYIESGWGTGASLPSFAPSLAGDTRARDWWGKFERLGATPGAAIALMRMNSQIDISDILPNIRVPCLVIHRAQDAVIDVLAGRELAQCVPGAEYLELDGEDHLPWVGATETMLAAIETFLKRADGSSADDRALATIVLIRMDPSDDRTGNSATTTIETALSHFRMTRIERRADDVIAAFDGPSRALAAAIRASQRLQRLGVRHRIGVHTGEIGIRAGRFDGPTLEIAADVCSHAREYEILVSRTVNDLVAGCGVALEDRGEHTVPTVDSCWRLFEAVQS